MDGLDKKILAAEGGGVEVGAVAADRAGAMRGADRDTIDAFEQAVTAVPYVLQAQRLFR